MVEQESILKRGWVDFQKAVASFWGSVFYLLGTSIVGWYTWSLWVPILFVIGTLFAIWMAATVSAPYRQRNDERRERTALTKEILALRDQLSRRSKPRRLDREQVAVLVDAIRASGVRPNTCHVIYAPSESESADLAADLGDAITGAGIQCSVHNGGRYAHDPRARGLKIVRDKSNRSIVALGDAIHRQLSEFNLNPTREDSEQKDGIYIYVARRAEEL